MTSRVYCYRPAGYGDLKSAEAALVDAAGGVRAAADKCRIGKSQISDAISPWKDDVHLPLDVAMQLEAAAQAMPVTEHLAAAQGCVLVRLPRRSPAPVPDWLGHVARIAQEAGDVLRHGGLCLADSEVTGAEAARWLRELDQSLAAQAALRVALAEAVARKGRCGEKDAAS